MQFSIIFLLIWDTVNRSTVSLHGLDLGVRICTNMGAASVENFLCHVDN